MGQSTTIRVTRQLHDRLTHRAESAGTTLAGAIELALDAEEQAEFWEQVAARMGSPEARASLAADAVAFSGTLKDGLEPDESWNDEW